MNSKRFTRKSVVAVALSVVALLVVASAAFALSNTQWRNDLDDVGGVSHRSKVAYTKQALPFIAYIDYVRYGGRVHPADGWGECCGQWRHNQTRYQRWTGSKWKSVKTKGADETWETRGRPDDLHYETFGDDVDLHDGALVRQRIQYRRLRFGPGDKSEWITVGGDWNNHFLE